MLYFLGAWTFLIISCCLIGTALLNILKADSFERVGDRLIAALWLGVVVLSISLLATSLVLPLSPLVGAVITVGICSLSLLLPSTRTEMIALLSLLSLDLILGFLILELGVTALTTRQVTWIDTGLYHYGFIRWLSEFGAVPGVALLLPPLGFTSSWLALAAPLNAEIFDGRVSAVTNGFAFLIAVLHFLICFAHIFTNKAQLSDWLVVISSLIIIPIVATNNLMSVILVSPSPDIPVLFIIGVVAWAILKVFKPRSSSLHKVEHPILNAKIVPLILSAGAVTIKLIALPLLFISCLIYVFAQGFSARRVLMGSAVTALLLSPMFIFGIITSGCPLYPSSFLCLDLPWSPTAQAAKEIAQGTHGWTTWYGSPPPGTISGLWLLWQWFSTEKLNTVMGLLILISALNALYIVNLKNRLIPGAFWLLALGGSGITFLICTAPFFRFGLGYIIILPALSIAIYCQKEFGNIWSTFPHTFISFYKINNSHRFKLEVILFLAAITIVISFNHITQARLFLPSQLPKANLIKKQVNDITYFSPIVGPCWAAELPCTFQVQSDVKLRDPARGIKAGFVHKK